ncbi:uncharacterized protein B0T23DRAFT_434107 [Neurospora hispaniola]|uniref:Zn(2)-C6 fungal-type domain-containing protein n=1 Tax=Neurospora hispaniola TaxID=588809 RepID=A0AAJ0IF01_9PEZI|nr:hypothetical protein B0T23DRAFT_434107 [Neurospora hispaniola]
MSPKTLKQPVFFCIHCGNKFTRKEHLERHIASHTGAKPWSCVHCFMPFNRQDLLRRHMLIYHSVSDDLDPIPPQTGAHKPDVACQPCHKAKCQCDKQKPTCGACKKKGITCVPRESRRVVKQETRARRSAAPQQPPPPAQVPLPAQPTRDEQNQQEPVMEASLETMIDGEAYQQERQASHIQQGLYQGTGPQSLFIPQVPLTGNLAPGVGFPNFYGFPNPSYGGFDGYGNPIQPFGPKPAHLGSQNDPSLNIPDLSPGSSTSIETGFETLDEIPDMNGFSGYGEVVVNGNNHHSLAGDATGLWGWETNSLNDFGFM